MKHSRFFAIAVAVLLGLYGMVGLYFLPLANFEGDLTRMAKLPESMFGWTKTQPVIDPADMISAEWGDADVLAIGDSFTSAQVWQTVFARKGVRVRTESWGKMNNLCGDIADWVRSKGFKGKVIVIESAEKYLEDRLASSVRCQRMMYRTLSEAPALVPHTEREMDAQKYGGRFSIGILTALNVQEYERLGPNPDIQRRQWSPDVYMERLKNGCELFSHARCNDVLFYSKDRVEDFDENVLNNMEIINSRLAGYTTVWAVIPDKATVYLHHDKTFWNEAERRFRAPNLLKELRRAVDDKTVDLYLANNTHVSTEGYLVLGNAIYRNIYL